MMKTSTALLFLLILGLGAQTALSQDLAHRRALVKEMRAKARTQVAPPAAKTFSFPSYLDNLDRLRIIKVSYTEELNDPQQYERLEEIHGADLYREVIGSDNHDVLVVKGVATITNFGVQFRDACTAPD